MRQFIVFSYLFAFCINAIAADKPALTIAVASNFAQPLQTLLASDETWSKANIRFVVGSTGVLYTQIVKGAPFDVFFAADSLRPTKLHDKHLSDGPVLYAIGNLVAWNKRAVKPDPEDVVHLIRTSLTDNGKIAIANPNTAPFGRAAYEVISNTMKDEPFDRALVLGNNVSQAFQFVDSGNANLGLIAESLLLQAQSKFNQPVYGQYQVVPQHLYEPILQSVVVIRDRPNRALARQLVEFVTSQACQSMLVSLGYKPGPNK